MGDGIMPPAIVFRGRLWPASEIAAIATARWNALGEPFRASSQLTAMVMANHPDAVALFFALSACQAPLILLPPDPLNWRTSPVIPPGTRLVLSPMLRHLEPQSAALGLDVQELPDSDLLPPARELPFLSCPGFVFFTSGSTGLARPVYRTTRSLVDASTALTDALQFPPDAGVLGVLPLDRSYGMNNGLMAATVLGRPLGLLERFDHTEFLALCATGTYWYWAGTPVMADILSRSQQGGSAAMPAMCVVAGRLSVPVCNAFEARFSTPLRQLYGTTETLTITVDTAPSQDVRSEMVVHPLPGVEVMIGDTPQELSSVGTPGRIWVRSRWLMEGYGFPPDLQSGGIVDGWWPTPDLGQVEADGRLALLGRLDDRIRTGAGHVVTPGEVAAALEGYPGVTDVAVVPINTAMGSALGALVEIAEAIRLLDLRNHLVRSLPAWTRPRALQTVSQLPRLATGRVDRRACIELLEDSLHFDNLS